MKSGRQVAYAAVATALATVFLVTGELFVTLSLSAAFMASLAMMLPLSKKSYTGAILSYIATAVLSLLIAGFRFEAVLPFAAFCGLHPTVNVFCEDKKVNKLLATVIKDVWFTGVVLLTYFLTDFTVGGNEFLREYIVPVLIVGSLVCFPFYDYAMLLFQRKLDVLIKKLKL